VHLLRRIVRRKKGTGAILFGTGFALG
jgi:hypothetical protein